MFFRKCWTTVDLMYYLKEFFGVIYLLAALYQSLLVEGPTPNVVSAAGCDVYLQRSRK